jgi:uncharacterized protein
MKWFTRSRLIALGIGGIGAALFVALGLPLPWLFGPMAATLVAALMGVRIADLGQVNIGARPILGVAIGASITPEVVAQLPQLALTLALMPLYIICIGLIGVPFFRRVCGFDGPTSYYAAMPGGLQDMLLFGQEAGANLRALSLIHATRVVVVIVLVPIILTTAYGVTLDAPIGRPVTEVPLFEMALMVVAGWVGWKGGKRIGLFGAPIIGPMILTAVLSLADLIHTRPPAEAILAAQYIIGTGIGVYYVGVTLRELRHDVLSGMAFAVLLAGLAAVFTVFVTILGLAPPVEAFLAFAPGGQAEITVIAIVVGADLGFVIVHHIARFVLVIMGAPVVAAMLRRRRNGSQDGTGKGGESG